MYLASGTIAMYLKLLRLVSAITLSLLSLCVLGNPKTIANANPVLDLRFGVYRTDKATVMYKEFMPILNYLENDLAKRLNREVSIELTIFKTYMDGIDALVDNKVDFVRFGPSSYVLAKNRNSEIKLLVMEHRNGEKRFNGVIVVRQDSPYRKLSDLTGTRFAFGNEHSTIGRYLAQEQLVSAGMTGKDLKAFDYLGRHDKVFMAVAMGEFDAGSIKESSFKRYNKNESLRVLHSFINITKPWIANSNLSAELVKEIRVALQGLTDKAVLNELKISGFLPGTDSDYDFVRRAMRASKQFDRHRE